MYIITTNEEHKQTCLLDIRAPLLYGPLKYNYEFFNKENKNIETRNIVWKKGKERVVHNKFIPETLTEPPIILYNVHKNMDQNNEPPKIVFEGQEFQRSARSFQAPTPKIVQWVMKYSGGIVKDEKQANYVLLGLVVVVVVISLFLFFGGGGSKRPPGPPTPFQEGKL